MTTPYDDEPPLDPVLENVRRKLVRRMAWSLGIMMVGLMAVLGAIVYKISKPAENPADAIVSAIELDLPEGSEILSSDLDGDRVLLDVKLATGDRELKLISLKTGLVTTIQLK